MVIISPLLRNDREGGKEGVGRFSERGKEIDEIIKRKERDERIKTHMPY